MASQRDYYQILGVSETATTDEIKKAFRRLAKQYHPDRNPNKPQAAERFKEINEAHDVLSDPEKRKKYDQLRRYGAFAGGGARTCTRRWGQRRRLRFLRSWLVRWAGGSLLIDFRSPWSRCAFGRRRRDRDLRVGAVPRGGARRQGARHAHAPGGVPDVQRLGRSAGHDLFHLSRMQGPRNDLVRPGWIRRHASLPGVPGAGAGAGAALSHLSRRW